MKKQTGKEYLNSLTLAEQKAIVEIVKVENTYERLKSKGITKGVREKLENIIIEYSKGWKK